MHRAFEIACYYYVTHFLTVSTIQTDSISLASVTIDTYQTGKNHRHSAFSFPCDSLFPPFYRLLYFLKFKTTNPYLTSPSCPPLMIQQWGETGRPSGYCAIGTLPLSCDILLAVGTGSNDASDSNYSKNVLRLKELDTTQRVAFRVSVEYSPSVFYIVMGK